MITCILLVLSKKARRGEGKGSVVKGLPN
jgi:hypothetical protein